MISSYGLRILGTVVLLLAVSLLSVDALQEEPEFGPFGAFPSPPETELTGVSIDIMKLAVPSRFIWDTSFIPVRDQNKEDCVGMTGAAFADWFGWYYSARTPFWEPGIAHSSEMAYRKCREEVGLTGREGCFCHAMVRALRDYGLTVEEDWPQDTPDPVNPDFRSNASAFKIQRFSQINTPKELHHALFSYGPLLLCMAVTDGFGRSRDNYIALSDGEFIIDYHAILAIGIDTEMKHDGEKGWIRILNSWGPDWGENGQRWMSIGYWERYNGGTYWLSSRTDMMDRQQLGWEMHHEAGAASSAVGFSSEVEAKSPPESIRAYVGEGTEAGKDHARVTIEKIFPSWGTWFGTQTPHIRLSRLKLSYYIAQMGASIYKDGGMPAMDRIFIIPLDAQQNPLGEYSYIVACATTKGEAGQADADNYCRERDNTKYIDESNEEILPPGQGQLIPIKGMWHTLERNVTTDFQIDWSNVAAVKIRIEHVGNFLTGKRFETYFDDLGFYP